MTYLDLSQFRLLKQKIDMLEEEKQTLIKYSPSYDMLPHGKGGKADPVAVAVAKREKLEKKLTELKVRAVDSIDNIEMFIDNIQDENMQIIFRYRFILGYQYDKIGELLYMDRRTIARKIDSYLKKRGII